MASPPRVDLSLSLASTQPANESMSRGAVWHPYFVSSRGPVTIIDSILRDNEVAAGVARSLPTPRDMHVLGTKSELVAVEDAMALSVQSAVSVANLGQRLVAKNQEVQELTLQLRNQRSTVLDCHNMIRDLREELCKVHDRHSIETFQLKQTTNELLARLKKQKDEFKIERRETTVEYRKLQKDKADLSVMVERYSKEMKEKMDSIEKTNKRVREDQRQVFADTREFARLCGRTSIEAGSVKIVEPRAEGQSSKPTEATIEKYVPRPFILESEAESAKSSDKPKEAK